MTPAVSTSQESPLSSRPPLSLRPRSSSAATEWLPLAAVLACALSLRWLFVTGVVYLDDLGYAQAAHDLLAGQLRFTQWPGGQSRLALYAPVALCYWLFGASETSTLLFPLACSMGTVIVVYGLARDLSPDGAGALPAAFIWAVFPLDVQAAGGLLPDGPVTFFSALAVWSFLRAQLGKASHPRLAYAGSLAALVFAVLVKPIALIVMPFVVVQALLDRRTRRAGLAVAGLLTLAAATLYVYYSSLHGVPTPPQSALSLGARLAGTSLDWYQRVVSERFFSAFTPLALVAIVALAVRPSGHSRSVLLWAVVSFALFEFGSMSLHAYLPIPAADMRAGQILPVLVPLAVAAGVYLGQAQRAQVAWATAIAAIVVAAAAWLHVPPKPILSWSVFGVHPDSLPFAGISAVSRGLATVGALASPLMILRGARLRTAWLGGLLAVTGLASLHPALMATSEQKEAWYSNLREVSRFLARQPRTAVYVQNKVIAGRLNVASGFGFAFDYFEPERKSSRLRIAPDDLAQLEPSSLIVVDDEHLAESTAAAWGTGAPYLSAPPLDWRLLFVIGPRRGHLTRVYRVASSSARQEFEEARRDAAHSPTAEHWFGLASAAASAGEFCTAIAAWRSMTGLDPARAEGLDAPRLARACFDQRGEAAGANLLVDAAFADGTAAWQQALDARVERSVEPDAKGRRVLRLSYAGGNWGVLHQNVTLLPNTAYLYTARVRTTVPVVALYWQASEGHSFAERVTYGEWTTLAWVFVTPPWPQPVSAWCSPVLPMAPGDVWLADVRLSPLL